MIFSLLKIRKKTAAVFAGIGAGLACIWAVAAWQDLSMQEIFNMLLGSVLLLVGIMFAAFCLVAAFSLLKKLLRKVSNSD